MCIRDRNESLPRRILGHVCGILNDVNGVQKNPHGMRWVCQTAMRERVSSKKITKLVMKSRDGDRAHPQKPAPHRDRGQRDRENRQPLSSCKTRSQLFDRAQDTAFGRREKPNENQRSNEKHVQSDVAVWKIVAERLQHKPVENSQVSVAEQAVKSRRHSSRQKRPRCCANCHPFRDRATACGTGR